MAKAISILLVVLLHAVEELTYVEVEVGVVDEAMPVLGTMRMPLFFAASGIFAVRWASTRTWRDLLNHKIALLVWVFLIWQPVVLAYKLAEMAWLPNQPDNSVTGQLAKFVAAPIRPNGELWFLWALAVFFVVSKLLWTLPTWFKVGVPAIVSALWFAFADDVIPSSVLRAGGDGLSGVCAYFFFFIAAAAFAAQIKSGFSNLRWYLAVSIVAAWVGVEVALQFVEVSFVGLSVLVRILAVAAGFAAATMLVRFRPLAWLGANTLQVYVGHMVLIVVAVLAIHATGLDASDWAWILIPAVFAWGVLGSLVLHRAALRAPGGRYLYKQPPWFRLRARESVRYSPPG